MKDIANQVAYYGGIFILSWLVWWYTVYKISGFHLKSFTFNNGISLNGILYSSKKVSIELGSLRFRLWGNTRMIILDDLSVKVHPKPSSSKKTKSKSSNEHPENDLFMIYPSRGLAKLLVRFAIRHFPGLDIELRNTTLNINQTDDCSIEYFRFTLSSRYSKRNGRNVKFYFNMAMSNAKQVHNYANSSNPVVPISLSDLRIELLLQIDTIEGIIEDIRSRIFVNEFELSAYKIVKFFVIDFVKKHDEQQSKTSEDEDEQASSQFSEEDQTKDTEEPRSPKRNLAGLLRFHHKLHRTISEISIHLESANVTEIPFATIADNQDFGTYFSGERPQTSLDLSLKSSFFNYSKLDKTAAGFEVLFDPLIDAPIHLICSFQLLRLNFTKLIPIQSGNIGKESDEILNIPNWSFNYKTNILDHLVHGHGFKNCVMELFMSTSSPILDLNTKQLSEIFYNLVLLKKFMKLRHLRKLRNNSTHNHGTDSSEEHDSDADVTLSSGETKDSTNERPNQYSALRAYIFKLLNEYYPRLDIKLIVEQPRLAIRHYENAEVQLLNFTSSLLDFNLSTTDSRNYDAIFQILSPHTRYLEKSQKTQFEKSKELVNQKIIKIEHVNFQFEILKNLKFKSKTEVGEIIVDFTKLDVLAGVNNMLEDITGMAEKDLSIGVINLLLNSQIVETRAGILRPSILKTAQPAKSLEEKLIRNLPSWILECKFSISSVVLLLGARSVLIPREDLAVTEDFKDVLGDNNQLRYVRFGFDSLSVTLYNSRYDNTEPPFDDVLPVATPSSASSETLTSSIVNNSEFWSLNTKIENFSMSVLTNLDEYCKDFKATKLSKFLLLPSIEISVGGVDEAQEKRLKVDLNIGQIQLNMDRFKIFTLIGSIYLIKEFIIRPIKIMHSKFKSDLKRYATLQFPANESTPNKTLKDLISLQLAIKELAFTIRLGEDFKARIQGLKSLVTYQDGILTFSQHFIRLLTESPLVKNCWSRLLCADNIKVIVSDSSKSDIKVDINSDSIRIIQPHAFVVYKLFDNISISVKVIKYAVQCLLSDSNVRRKVIEPKESKTIDMPNIRLKSEKLAFAMEDDPFETELNMIYQLGLVEQRKRFEQLRLFEAKAGMSVDEIHSASKSFDRQKSGENTCPIDEAIELKPASPNELNVPKNKTGTRRSFKLRRSSRHSQSKSSLPLSDDEEHKNSVGTSQEASPQIDNREKLELLYASMSTSWIRKTKVYKAQLKKEIIDNKKHLFGNEALLSPKYNNNVVAYPDFAPLLSIWMNKLDLNLSTTKFKLEELPQFIHDIGQGVPLDTKYSLMIPTYVDLKLNELRIHLRDYPLPLLHVPDNGFLNSSKKRPCLSLVGHLIISEELIKAKEHVRKINLPFSPNETDPESSKYYAVTIAKSLSSVKLYTDMSCRFDSDLPSRFVWGQSYSFGIQQAMLNFDQFSKPPVDPSVKLGFWDKMRYIMHGKCQILTNKSLEVAFKGSSDPYDLFETSSGFVLSFKDDVVWKINENDDSRSFFDIHSGKVSWYIPNYLATPLVAWTRETSKPIYLPSSNKFITSCFGFQLQADGNLVKSTQLKESNLKVPRKNVVNLSGGVHFRVGFLLQRKNAKGQRTEECKPHYEIKLFNPEYTSDNHDSYAGFRSQYIHMAISFNANQEASYNSIHLSPKTFLQFFKWWKLFSGNMSLPIRRGKMFGEIKKAQKFSQLLYTNKFEFNFRSLFLSHMYRDESISRDDEMIQFVGIRAMIDSFSVDLHQRKETVIHVHEELSRNQKLMKMNFNIGEVHLSNIDLRVVHAIFKQDLYKSNEFASEKSKKNPDNISQIHDEDKKWFDIEDFEEAFALPLQSSPKNFNVHPLAFSDKFSYVRDTHSQSSEENFGDEDTHNCTLNSKNVFQPQIESLTARIKYLEKQVNMKKSNINVGVLRKRIEFLNQEIKRTEQSWVTKRKQRKSSSLEVNSTPKSNNGRVAELRGSRKASVDSRAKEPAESFNNKFILINMLLKWNFKNRNFLLKYIHFVQLKKSLQKYLSYDSIASIEKIMAKNTFSKDDLESITTGINSVTSDYTQGQSKAPQSSQERLKNFESILRQVNDHETIKEDYKIEIISPQIQLQSEEEPNSVIIIATPQIDSKIVSVINKSEDSISNAKDLATRFGVLMKNANIFVLHKEDLNNSDLVILSESTYGTRTNWPPWLGIEICKNGLWAGEDKLLVEKTSVMMMYEKIKPLGGSVESSDKNNSGEQKSQGSIVSSPVDKLYVDFPKLIVTSTSKQYFTLYVIVTTLLFYTEPMSKSIGEKLEKLKFSIDFHDLPSLHKRMIDLHNYYNLMSKLVLNYGFRQNALTNEQLNELLMLNMERGEVITEIFLLMQTIFAGNWDTDSGSSTRPKAHWFIKADEIILHMLEDDRTPMLDIALAKGGYRRMVNEDGSNENKLDIGVMQGFNLIKNARYQEFLSPIDSPKENKNKKSKLLGDSVLAMHWTMNKPIGGIKIIERFEISSMPTKIQVDEITSKKLMRYIFGTDSDLDQSPILNKGNSDDKDKGGNEYDDSVDPERALKGIGGAGFLEASDGTNKIKKDEDDPQKKIWEGEAGAGIKNKSGSESGSLTGSSKGVKFDKNTIESGSVSSAKKRQPTSSSLSIENGFQDQVDQMVERSKKYLSIGSLIIHPTSLQISIRLNKGYKRLLNVQNFLIDLPKFGIQKKILSFLEVSKLMEKFIIKILLSHIGKLLKNKMTVRRSEAERSRSLKPITRYAEFVNISELESHTSEAVTISSKESEGVEEVTISPKHEEGVVRVNSKQSKGREGVVTVSKANK